MMSVMDATEMLAMWGLRSQLICGCGNPEHMYEDIHTMLRFQKRFFDEKWKHDDPEAPWRQRDAYFGERYAEFILHALNKEGLLEHGSSVFGSWLTPLGVALLAALDECGYEHIEAGVLAEDVDRLDAEYDHIVSGHEGPEEGTSH